jgi:G:T-mismatch repair DNA endonuclease (very short patch repair protein)
MNKIRKTIDQKTNCLVCNKQHSATNHHTASHQRKHNNKLIDYLIKYFKESNVFKEENCGFCSNAAEYKIKIDFNTLEFTRFYDSYICNDLKCKENISLEIFGTPYNSKEVQYLIKSRKISIEDAKKLKYNKNKKSNSSTNLHDCILRYGKELGAIKYKERNDKISRSNTLDWYIENKGELLGPILYYKRIEQIKKATLGITKSKASNIIKTLLDTLNISYKQEYPFHIGDKTRPKFVDYYLPDYNIAIEYFGNYWHANPRFCEPDSWNKSLKKYANEIWERDKTRNLNIITYNKGVKIFIIWETNDITEEKLLTEINNSTNINSIIYL